jgi:hypothetical protein
MAPGDDAAMMRTVEALQARNIHVIVTDTCEEANNALIQLLPEGAEICDSTSETLDALGFTAFVRGNPRYNNLHDVYEAESDIAKRNDLRRRASIADYFIGRRDLCSECDGKSTGPVCLCGQVCHFSGRYPEDRAHL